MTFDQLIATLAEFKLGIVHFAHKAAMRDGVFFPDNLRNAIANATGPFDAAWELSTHVFGPSHCMELVGDVGLLFEPVATANVKVLCNDDAGASDYGADGRSELSRENIEWSLKLAEGAKYNEWRIKGMKPKGIFVSTAGVPEVLVEKYFPEHGITTHGQKLIEIDEIAETFPDLPIYTMTADGPAIMRVSLSASKC